MLIRPALNILIFLLLFIATASTLYAQSLMYMDEAGNILHSQSFSEVPYQYRNQVVKKRSPCKLGDQNCVNQLQKRQIQEQKKVRVAAKQRSDKKKRLAQQKKAAQKKATKANLKRGRSKKGNKKLSRAVNKYGAPTSQGGTMEEADYYQE